MDILHLVDRLEEIFNESRAIPFTHSVIVDEDKIFELIDQMRVCIPDEIKKSQQLLAQRDRILAQAQEESNRTVQLAREKTEQLVDQNSIVQAAQVRAEQIINQGRQEADNFRREADDYQLDSLTKMELEIERLLNQVRNGISVIQAEKSRPKE